MKTFARAGIAAALGIILATSAATAAPPSTTIGIYSAATSGLVRTRHLHSDTGEAGYSRFLPKRAGCYVVLVWESKVRPPKKATQPAEQYGAAESYFVCR